MLITVKYRDGKVGMVKFEQLETLIRSRKITQFMRSEGWVSIETDSIRKNEAEFRNPERRQGCRKKG